MTLPPPITSRSNARVKALRAASNGEASTPGEMVAVEGEILLAEAVRARLRLQTVFVREGSEDVLRRPALAGLQAENWAVLSRDVFASAVDTASPQGIAAMLEIPAVVAVNLSARPTVVLVAEALQDPGNMGTLLRSAEAFGVRQVFVTPETVSCWNPKAVRASAGSVFRVPVVRASLPVIKEALAAAGVRLLAAVAQTDGATRLTEASLLAPCALVIGNEGAGLSALALSLADARVHIPCAVESLNAAIAGSTLMYEAMRQNLQPHAEGTA